MEQLSQVLAFQQQASLELRLKEIEQEDILKNILSSIRYHDKPDFLPFVDNGVKFDVVTDKDSLLEAFRLRFISYRDAKYINPSNYPLEMEFDKYDSISIHFIARNQAGNLVGYSRLIPDTDFGMHIDNLVDLSDVRTQYKICEYSRMISHPSHQPDVNRGLRYSVYRLAQKLGVHKIVGISLERDKEIFTKKLFVPMEPYRTCAFEDEKDFSPLLNGMKMYATIFHLDRNEEHIKSLRR